MAKRVLCGLLLDETGSMASHKDNTLKGVNSYLEELKGGYPEATVVLSVFNSHSGYRVLRRGMAKGIDPVRPFHYRPQAMTPLYDAMMQCIVELEFEADGIRHGTSEEVLVIFVTITDGYENQSKEHSLSDIKAAVEEKKEAGWEIVFLGADIDAFGVGGGIGVSRMSTQTFSMKAVNETLTAVAHRTINAATNESYVVGNFFADDNSTDDDDGNSVPTSVTVKIDNK